MVFLSNQTFTLIILKVISTSAKTDSIIAFNVKRHINKKKFQKGDLV